MARKRRKGTQTPPGAEKAITIGCEVAICCEGMTIWSILGRCKGWAQTRNPSEVTNGTNSQWR